MTYEDVTDLLDYHYWACGRLLDNLANITPEQFAQPMGSSFDSIRDTLAHMLKAESIWVSRLKGEKPEIGQTLELYSELSAIRSRWSQMERELRACVTSLGRKDIDKVLAYKDLRGNDQLDPVSQILLHVVNHGTYHRGQVTTMLRQMKVEPPPSTDLIVFHRERNRTRPKR